MIPKYKTVFTDVEYTIVAKTWNFSLIPDDEKDNIKWKIIEDGKETDLKDKGESINYTFDYEQAGKRIIFKAFNKSGQNFSNYFVFVSLSQIVPSWKNEYDIDIKETPYGSTVKFNLLFKKMIFPRAVSFKIKLENENGQVLKEIDEPKNITHNNTSVSINIDEKWRDLGPKHSLFNLYLSVKIDGLGIMDTTGYLFDKSNFFITKLIIKDFFVDEDGLVINPRVKNITIKNFGKKSKPNDLSDPKDVKAMVLHRTDGYSISSALGKAKNSNEGGHFTIEGPKGVKTSELSGEDGSIYQFCSLKKAVNHVGRIRPKPQAGTDRTKWDIASETKHNNEVKKKYPDRFPYNIDSIGLEVVGKNLTKDKYGHTGTWEELSDIQVINSAWIVNGVMDYFSLDKTKDLYVHENISSKVYDEGGKVLTAIKPYI